MLLRLDTSGRKPNKIWIDKGSEFYNRSMKSWLQDNDMEMYSTHNKEKSVVAERSIRALEKQNKYMTSISKNEYIAKLVHVVNKYRNIYHSTIKMKPVDVKTSSYFNFDIENSKDDPKFKVGDLVRISKYNFLFFAKRLCFK